MQDDGSRPGRTSRRGVLRLLALAPAALAGCATAGTKPSQGREAAAGAPPPRPAAAPAVSAAAVASIRSFPVPADTEPAQVFRAAGSRAGEPR
jgi:hypothetical protein